MGKRKRSFGSTAKGQLRCVHGAIVKLKDDPDAMFALVDEHPLKDQILMAPNSLSLVMHVLAQSQEQKTSLKELFSRAVLLAPWDASWPAGVFASALGSLDPTDPSDVEFARRVFTIDMPKLGARHALRSFAAYARVICESPNVSVEDLEFAFEQFDKLLEAQVVRVNVLQEKQVAPLLKGLALASKTCEDQERILKFSETLLAEVQESFHFVTGPFSQALVGWLSAKSELLGRPRAAPVKTAVSPEGVCRNCSQTLHDMPWPEEFSKLLLEKTHTLFKEDSDSQAVFNKFTKWLDNDAPKFDVAVDAANVAHYCRATSRSGQRVYGGFSWEVLGSFLRFLRDVKKLKPIVVVHASHVSKQKNNKHRVSVMKEFSDSVFIVPHGNNDDWFWLYASVKFDLPVITNDNQRDHQFAMLSPRYFRRWLRRRKISFHVEADRSGNLKHHIYKPPQFSERMQLAGERAHVPIKLTKEDVQGKDIEMMSGKIEWWCV